MDATIRKLTIVCPAVVEIALIECLDGLEPALPGYTILAGEGRGENLDLPSAAERVRGAMRVFTVQMILPEADIPRILEAVRTACPRPNIAYWVEPVLDFGRLT